MVKVHIEPVYTPEALKCLDELNYCSCICNYRQPLVSTSVLAVPLFHSFSINVFDP